MEIELIEIRDFLAAHPPFDRLPADCLERLPKQLSVRYQRRGTPFPPEDADGDYLYIVRSGAIETRDEHDELMGKYGEGELYPADCFEDAMERQFTAHTVEDTLLYLLPCERVAQLRRDHSDFNQHFSYSMRERLRRALTSLQERQRQGDGLMNLEVRQLLGREAVTAPPNTSIHEAAKKMTEERVSALLLTDDHLLVGIITDRDLRSRVLAEGLDYQRPVSEIMTRKLVKVSPDTPAFEALITMTRLGVHHLPVVDRNGIRGVISSSDLIRHESANALYLVSDLRRCDNLGSIVERAEQLPELQVQMVASGATAYHIGQAISSMTDAITCRLLELAEAELGAPPVPYVWLAGGSQARREQMVHADQDNALLLDDSYDPSRHGDYFTTLAQRVTDGLNACGFFYCPGEVMARNPDWRQPLKVWRRYFDRWITNPERKALMLASNFFDLRPIYGETGLYDRLHASVLQQSQANRIFLAHLAANALHNHPPLGFFRNFVLISNGDHAKTFDLKHRGLIPVVDLARVHAIAAGLPELNTIERLHAAAESSALSDEGAADLEDAMEFIATLRARHQAGQIKRGERPDNFVAPEELAPMERSHLKDAFSVINTMQSALGQRYQAGRFT